MAFLKTSLAPVALAMTLMAAGASSADAWSRSSQGTGPRGNSWNSSTTGNCSGGTCSRTRTVNGPRGTSTRTGSTSCTGGTCSHTGTVTGPYGNSVTRSGTVTRY